MTKTIAALMTLALSPVLLVADDCESGGESPTPGFATPTITPTYAGTPLPDGELAVVIDNPELTDLLPITHVEAVPVGSVATSFATTLTITTDAGTLTGLDVLDFLGLEFNISAVLLTCANGDLLPLGSFETCGGANLEVQQTRNIQLIGTALGGVILDSTDLSLPLLTIKMTEEDAGQRSTDDGDPFEREGEDERERGTERTYVHDTGMSW